MQKPNKIRSIAIAVFLIFVMTASAALMPSARAQTGITLKTFAYINAAPNPIGVNQQTYIIMWINLVYDNAYPTNNYRFQNYQLTIVGPSGTTTVNFPIIHDPTSAQDYAFTPSAAGKYTITFSFPEMAITATNDDPTSPLIGDSYGASSATTTLVVQQAPIASALSSAPLPTAYWTRPIYGENTAWYTIASNWLGAGIPGYQGWGAGSKQPSFAADSIGSLTAHVMWTKELQAGGIVGGNTVAIPANTYFEGSAYSQRYQNPIILDGMLYYNPPEGVENSNGGPLTCVNLQTGQVVWTKNIGQMSFGYIYDAEDPNQHGVWPPMLVYSSGGGIFSFGSSVWNVYDAWTGDSLFNLTNVPSGTTMLGPSGEILIVSFVNLNANPNPFAPPLGPPEWYLQEWNSSRLWDNLYSGGSTTPDNPPPISDGQIAVNAQGVPTGQPVDATWTGGYILYEGAPTYVASLYDFNISMPTLTTAPTIADAYYNNALICENGTMPGAGAFFAASPPWPESPYNYFAVDMSAGHIGTIKWWSTVPAAGGNISVTIGDADPTANGGKGVFTEGYKETMQWVGYSMATGAKLWGPTDSMAPLDYYGNPAIPIIGGTCAYGNLYSTGYAGILYCWNMTTGNLEWTYGNGGEGNSTYAGFDTPFGVYPMQINAIGGGVVYMVTTEHTIETPLFKGAFNVAVNATTGKQIWALSGYTGEFFAMSYAMADGYNTWFNGYDNSIYVVGKGPSQTTVSAPSEGLTMGTPVVIKGTVMDISPGTKQYEQASDFPNGVPVSSDASMQAWMAYVYQQQPCPSNFTGAPVTITVTDSNHNTRVIGTAMTDGTGTYRLTWIPDIPGNFTVYATFAGNAGYYGSQAEDGFAVYQPAVSTTPVPTATPTSVADLYFVPAIAGLFVLIIVVAIVLALLMLRKRP
jgi:hypothetical protein